MNTILSWAAAVALATAVLCLSGTLSVDRTSLIPHTPSEGHSNSIFPSASHLPVVTSFAVTFAESGLPSATNWSVTCNGTTVTSSTPWINFTEPAGNYSFSVGTQPGFDASPWTGFLLVVSQNVTQGILFGPHSYSVTFTESGLPAPNTWGVQVDAMVLDSQSPQISFSLPNGSYVYQIGASGSWVPSPETGTVAVKGSAVSINVTFTSPTFYGVTFIETGLSFGTVWYVFTTAGQGTTSSTAVTINVTNGSYSYLASVVSAGWVSNDSAGNVTVSGANVSIQIHFLPAPFRVTFVETGLPYPGVFQVGLNGRLGAGAGSVSLSEPDGAFPFQIFPALGLTPSPMNGTVVVNGQDLVVAVTFGEPSYPVAFTEVGLPLGTTWSVYIDGITGVTNSSSLSFSLPDGLYNYAVSPVAGFASPGAGSVLISGQAVSIPLSFTQTLFALTFHEVGLPSGTTWGVLLGSESASSQNANITFTLPSGSYGFVVIGISGYSDSAPVAAFLNGADTTVTIQFALETYPIVFVQFGLPVGSLWTITVTAAVSGASVTKNSTANSITFFLPNGSYQFVFGLPQGYQGNATSSTFTVAGVPVSGGTISASLPVIGPPGPGPVGGSSSSPFPWLPWTIAAASALTACALFLTRLRGPPPTIAPRSRAYEAYREATADLRGPPA